MMIGRDSMMSTSALDEEIDSSGRNQAEVTPITGADAATDEGGEEADGEACERRR